MKFKQINWIGISIIVLFIFLFLPRSIFAQRNCGAMEHLEEQLLMNPGMDEEMQRIEKLTQQYISRAGSRMVEGVITIPVVVHVVYNHTGENISDAQIQSQLDVLNDDFRRMNGDADNIWGQAADAELEFCLATQDPNGDATCGIIRVETDSTKFYSKLSMKSRLTGGSDPWPYEDYLNMWVCDISGLLGFATFPGGPAHLDGVVTDYRAFGTIGDLKSDFALGRTTTHEIGHWLNLRHVWGDGDCNYDDFVSDTPQSDDPNYNCDTGHVSCGSVDMVQNYMDYSDDVCMNLFTIGQKTRMRALFEPGGFREKLLNSKGCEPPNQCNALTLTINFDNYPSDISWNIKNSGGSIIVYDENFDNLNYAGQTIYYDLCFDDGNYEFNIVDSYGDGLCCNVGNGSYVIETPYEQLHSSGGQFQSGETIPLVLDKAKYRFIGPGTNWDFAGNWNKGTIPSACYDGEIQIESDCVKDGGLINWSQNLRVKSGGELTLRQ